MGPISSKSVSSQDPLLRKFGNFSLYSLNFAQILALKPSTSEIFSSQAPKLRNFKFTRPPFQIEANVSSQAPHFGNPGRTPLPEKSCAPRGFVCQIKVHIFLIIIPKFQLHCHYTLEVLSLSL